MTETDNNGKNRKCNGLKPGRLLAVFLMALNTALFVAMLVTGDQMNFIFALTAIFWLPLILIGLVIIIVNIVRLFKPNLRNTYNFAIVIWGIVNILLLAGVWIHDDYLLKQVDAEHLIDHYVAHETEIWDLAAYTRAAMDSGAWMDLEFDGNNIVRFHTQPAGDTVSKNWHDKGAFLPDTIGSRVGVTPEEIDGIRQRMKAAGCISIELKNYGTAKQVDYYGKIYSIDKFDQITIGRKRYSMSGYSYVLFRQPMSDSTWNRLLNDEVTRIPVCDSMALEYGSPAFGSIKYPNRDKIVKQLNLKER